MNIKFYLISFFVLFCNFETIYSIMPSNRNISIYIDCGIENVKDTLNQKEDITDGLGAVTTDFLNILNQEPGPILVGESTLINIMAHKVIFDDFVSLSLTELYTKYSDKYLQFKDRIHTANFSLICRYYNNLYNQLNNILKISNTANQIIQNIYQNPYFDKVEEPKILETDQSYKKYIVLYLMCSKLPIDRYVIKEITLPEYPMKLFLFIPFSYIKLISPGYIHTKTDQIKPIDAPLEDIEKSLGLKFNHYPDIDLIVSNFQEKKIRCQKIIVNLLSNIFVKKSEADNVFNVWSILMRGHGRYYQSSSGAAKKYKKEKEQFEKKLDQEKILLINLQSKQKESPNNNDIIKDIQNTQLNINELEKNINDIQKEINKHLDSNMIAGLPGSEFTKVLKFFNDKIFTGFLFYTSCYAGGQNFVDPFKEITTSLPLSLNYGIASDTLTEAKTIGAFPKTYLQTYKNGNQKYNIDLDKLVDLKEKKIIFYSDYNFRAFFDGLKQETKELLPYKKLFSYISDPVKIDTIKKELIVEGLRNIPSIRFPGTFWFSVIDFDNYLIALTKVKTLTQGKEPLKVNYGPKEIKAILLYQENIPFVLDIERQNPDSIFPSIVSMLPGKARHQIEGINAPKYKFSEIIKGFYLFTDLRSSKFFFIKKMTVISDRLKKIIDLENVAFIINGLIKKEPNSYANIISMEIADKIFTHNWPIYEKIPENIIYFFNNFKEISENNIPNLIQYFNDIKEPEITGQFTGIVKSKESEEKVTIEPLVKSLQEKLKLIKNPALKDQHFKSKIFETQISKQKFLNDLMNFSSSLENLKILYKKN